MRLFSRRWGLRLRVLEGFLVEGFGGVEPFRVQGFREGLLRLRVFGFRVLGFKVDLAFK